MFFFEHSLFLYSLFSIGILVLFHLIKRKNIKEVEFPSLIFILKSHKKISKKLKIKEFILFLLRLLVLLSIIFLITNISLKKKENSISFKSNRNTMIVLDNNYQMLLKTNKSENDFEKAKTVIRTFFQNNPNSNSLFYNGKEHIIVSISQLNNLLNKIRITYNYKYSSIFNFIKNKSKFKNKKVIIVSNYQDTKNSSNIKYSLIKHKSIDNFFIEDLKIKRIEYNRYQLKALISSSSTNKQTKKITLYQDNNKISSSIINLVPNSSKEIMMNFTILRNKKGKKQSNELEYKLELEADNLNYDNYKFFIINTIKPKEILIVNGSTSNISYQDESFYLKNALNSSNEKYKFNLTQKSWITSKSIKRYDLIIFLNNIFDDYENQYAISEYLKSGKSVFISLGSNTNINNFNYFWKGIISLRNFKNLERTKKYKFINFFNYDYDFLKNILFIKNQLSSYPIFKYFNLSTKQNIKTIASLNDGTPFIAEKLLKKGKLIIYTSSIDRDWNNFPLSTNYAPLVISIVKYLLEDNLNIYKFYLTDLSNLENFKYDLKHIKTGIYQHYNKIAYNSPLKYSNLLIIKNKKALDLIANNNLLIPLKNWFIMIFMFMIFLETLFFVKRFLWVKDE